MTTGAVILPLQLDATRVYFGSGYTTHHIDSVLKLSPLTICSATSWSADHTAIIVCGDGTPEIDEDCNPSAHQSKSWRRPAIYSLRSWRRSLRLYSCDNNCSDMIDPEDEQRIINAEHLRLLRIGYFISAGTTGFFACFGMLYALMGVFVTTMLKHATYTAGQRPPPEFMGWFFGAVGLGMTVFFGTGTLLKLRAARCIRLRTSHGFCVAIAVISCLEIPYGTALGILSFMVLSRPAVKSEFLHSPAEPR